MRIHDDEAIRTSSTADRALWLKRRAANINASDVGALFHVSPYRTALELWAEKVGRIPPVDVDNVAMRRGRIFEPAVAAALQEAHPDWIIRPYGQYVEHTALRLGCTPDYAASDADGRMILVQAKTVAADLFENEWLGSPPASYLFQVQAEMLLTGVRHCVLVAMVMDGREFPIHEYPFDYDEEFGAAIVRQAGIFWKHVDERREPPMKPSQDGDTLFRLHPQSEDEPVLMLHGRDDVVAICEERARVSAEIKALEKRKDELGCKLMAELRNHKTAEAMDWRISWPTVPAMRVVQDRKAHRRLTVRRIKGGNNA